MLASDEELFASGASSAEINSIPAMAGGGVKNCPVISLLSMLEAELRDERC